MSGYYTGKIKVVSECMMCFPVDAKTLEPLSTGGYDPHAWTHPEDEVETISVSEWNFRLGKKRGYL